MAACSSTSYDEQESAKRASLLRCPNKQYTAPFWFKVKQLFIGKDQKKNVISDEQKRIRQTPLRKVKTKFDISCGRICGIILLVALFCCSSGGFFIMWFTDLFLKQVLEAMTIHNGSFMFEPWRKPSLKPLICIYAFNYTNLDQYILPNNTEKLHVKEIGPYCYRETLEKVRVHFNDEEGTVTYGNKRTHEFDPSHSKGHPDDLLVLPNPAIIFASSKLSEYSPFSPMRLTGLILPALMGSSKQTVLRVKAHDFIFGYDDRFLKMTAILAQILEFKIPFKKFGILALRAAETDDTLTVKTGRKDLEHIDTVTEVNGKPNLTVWYGNECNRIDGSDGAFFPRKELTRTKTLYLFHQDICRRLPLVFDKDIDFQDGIMGMRYHMPPWVYDTDGTCFCKTNCPPKGVFALTRCAHGIPFLMSFPHFLHGDPSLTENIEGLHPNISHHDFYIDIQPILGFTLGMVSRLQVNMQVIKTPEFQSLSPFQDNIILPIVWIEVFADHLPLDLFRVIYHATFSVRILQLFLMWGTLICSVVTALCIIHCLWKIPGRHKQKSKSQREPVLETITSVSLQLHTINISQFKSVVNPATNKFIQTSELL